MTFIAASADASGEAPSSLFAPFHLRQVNLGNRLAVAPMTRISANDDGSATPRMAAYYRSFAEGGFGLVITEGIYTDRAYAQGYFNQPGLTDERQTNAWRAVVEAVHAAGGRIIAQLMHAGRCRKAIGTGKKQQAIRRPAERPTDGVLPRLRSLLHAGSDD